ncbi:hypothetical protein [Streptacidiphilus sp. PAMC 29251]
MDHQELLEQAREALAGLTADHDAAVAQVVAFVREQTGETIAVRKPGVMDASLSDLFSMENQARSYLEAMKAIRRWVMPGDPRPLGNRLKVIPPEEAELITGHLRDAGVLG